MSELTRFQKIATLSVLSLALAIIIIDTTLLNVALSAIIKDLHTTLQNLQWVITAYALMLAAFTVTGGRIGDLFGRKRMFILGAALFAIGSLIASYSHNMAELLAGESIIEGIGAALMMPATASLLVSTFKGRERAMAFGVWGGVAAASSAIGPLLGGYLTTHYSWRWGFRINVFVAAVLILFSFVVREARDRAEKQELDFLCVIFSSLGLLGVVFGIVESSTYGWWTAKQIFSIGSWTLNLGALSIVPYSILAGLVFLTAFVFWEIRREKKRRTPLISMHLFQNHQFASGTLTLCVITLGMSGIIFTLPIFLQSVLQLDAFNTGLALLPMSIAILVGSPLSAYLSKHVMPKRLIQVGLFINIIAFFLLRSELTIQSQPADFIPSLLLYGFGMGLIQAQINNMVLSSVSVQQAGEASGVTNTFRQLGQSLGSAIIGAVLISSVQTNLPLKIQSNPVIPQNVKEIMSHFGENQITATEFGQVPDFIKQLPLEIQNEIRFITYRTTTAADHEALLYAALFAMLGFLISFSLPSVRNLERGEPASAH